jgi:hypothetical protein
MAQIEKFLEEIALQTIYFQYHPHSFKRVRNSLKISNIISPCFQAHAHSSPANLLQSAIYVFCTGGYIPHADRTLKVSSEVSANGPSVAIWAWRGNPTKARSGALAKMGTCDAGPYAF